MKQDSKPLWQRLNEERTQGDWTPGTNKASKEWMQLFCNKKVILEVNTIHRNGQRQNGDFDKEEANAQYTALAVNNLASLAEALDEAINRVAYCIDLWEMPDEAVAMLRGEIDAMQKTLNKIS